MLRPLRQSRGTTVTDVEIIARAAERAAQRLRDVIGNSADCDSICVSVSMLTVAFEVFAEEMRDLYGKLLPR